MSKTKNGQYVPCRKCNGSKGRHGKSPDGVRLGPWIPCSACTTR
jgi:hypothetical protein